MLFKLLLYLAGEMAYLVKCLLCGQDIVLNLSGSVSGSGTCKVCMYGRPFINININKYMIQFFLAYGFPPPTPLDRLFLCSSVWL